jgi:DNA-binding transcriptional ArsR family regulator
MTVLRYFITSKAKRTVLKLFLADIDSTFYTREVARLTGEPLNAVRRELGYMEKAGLLRSHVQGNLKYFEVVRDFPFLAEWRKIILRTPEEPPAAAGPHTHTVDKLKVRDKSYEEAIIPGARVIMERQSAPAGTAETARATLGQAPARSVAGITQRLAEQFKDISSVTLVLIHGEAAISTEIPRDGVDLLVVGDVSEGDLLQLLAGVEDETGVKINLRRMTRSDFDYRNVRGDPFVRRIWSEKKLVVKARH